MARRTEPQSKDEQKPVNPASDGGKTQTSPKSPPARLCMSCREYRDRDGLLRLTVDHQSNQVVLKSGADRKTHGRSAYICAKLACLERALKGNKLKGALEGRSSKNKPKARKIQWPLEPQLIHTLRRSCTENGESCQNTQEKESVDER